MARDGHRRAGTLGFGSSSHGPCARGPRPLAAPPSYVCARTYMCARQLVSQQGTSGCWPDWHSTSAKATNSSGLVWSLAWRWALAPPAQMLPTCSGVRASWLVVVAWGRRPNRPWPRQAQLQLLCLDRASCPLPSRCRCRVSFNGDYYYLYYT